jgi:hypothetical protein
MKSIILDKSFKISLELVLLIIVTSIVFLFSFFFAPLYYDGDSVPYTKIYNSVAVTNIADAYYNYKDNLNGSFKGNFAHVHFLYIWISNLLGFERNFVMAVANAILSNLALQLFLQLRVSLYVAITVIFTNYYVFGLYFAAERLKFGFIFLILALLYAKRRKLSYLFAVLSIFSHAQQLIIFFSILFSFFTKSLMHILATSKIKFTELFSSIYISIIFIIVAFILGEHVLNKISVYFYASSSIMNDTNIFKELLKIFIFYALTLFYSKEWLKVSSVFIVLIAVTILVGEDRVNMLGYFFFLFYAMQYKRGVNLGILISSIYFGYKSILFIINVLETGQGYG